MSWCKWQWLRRSFSTSSRNRNSIKPRINEINIQLLSESLHKQIFNGHTQKSTHSNEGEENVLRVKTLNESKQAAIQKHLSEHKLWNKTVQIQKDVNFKLPDLLGRNVSEHFQNLAQKQVQEYARLANKLYSNNIVEKPTDWAYCPGWVKYLEDGEIIPVDCPEEQILVFDVEVVVQEGNYPVLATAMSDKYWYSWCSESLFSDKFRWSSDVLLEDLIPLESPTENDSNKQRLVIGHNVAFDRSFVKEQYLIKKSRTRFMDTMSLHIAVCGLTNFQRVLYKAAKNDSNLKVVREYKQKQRIFGNVMLEDWKEVSSLNNLKDVHALHCGGKELDKDPRNIFIEGTTEDVRENFQELMHYCADDVIATCDVFKVLWPEFNERFPHPVSLSGMLEMATGYLPINQNWERFVHQSNAVYEDMQRESKQLLMKLANDACKLLENEKYKKDPWLWDLDWTYKSLKMKKDKPLTKLQLLKLKEQQEQEKNNPSEESCLEDVLKKQEKHYKAAAHLIGYPEWYKQLCMKIDDEDWMPGPCGISHQTRVTPKLLRLTWDEFPLHFDDTHGWGYLVPGRTDNLEPLDELIESKDREYPYRELYRLMGWSLPEEFMYYLEENNDDSDDVDNDADDTASVLDIDDDELTDEQFEVKMDSMLNHGSVNEPVLVHLMENMLDGVEGMKAGRKTYKHPSETKLNKPNMFKVKHKKPSHVGDGPHNSVDIPGCWFFKIPHKDGKGKRVVNPLAKDYLSKVEDGTLSAQSGPGADMVLKLNKACSYWKNNQKRIESQMSAWLTDDELPEEITGCEDYVEGSKLGAIVPRVVPAGTITRRGVEPTWLTASNAYSDRIGSELKAMVQAPPGYKFIGADVDSQELWIGAVLGDAHFGKCHGCTALGWMTLQGNKKDKTDLHSVVAETINISRDHAKVFNYGRIYGAGQKFAEKLLQKFNHRLTAIEAKEKANTMFTTTKGKRNRLDGKWYGGSESSMFNKLELIAQQEEPRTPVLGCRISKALEPEYVNNDFMTSRINWVVQSSAVDYLHMMLVCMQWLFDEYDINGRFCISIHDEVRYLVVEEDVERAALALQITNLLTRAMFAYKLGMDDLPLSVAFFSAIDVDSCLRKEVNLDCKTPSNPHGLEQGYGIPSGVAMDIYEVLKRTKGSLKSSNYKMDDKNEKQFRKMTYS
ncbi:hypothetical protein ACF0H5_013584 [Mactra antiquata]